MKSQRRNGARLGRWAGLCAAGLCAASNVFSQSGFLPRVDVRLNGSAQDMPHMATDGKGVWVTTWTSNEGLLSPTGLLGLDDDILSSRSLDGGRTWSAPAVVNADEAAIDDLLGLAPEENPKSAGDGLGAWIAVWESEAVVIGGKGILSPPERDIHFAVSSDAAATWSGPFNLEDFTGGAVNTHGVTDRHPQVVFAGNDTWILVWAAEGGDLALTDADSDLFSLTSQNGGATWTGFQSVNLTASGDTGADTRPAMATDGAGTTVVAWDSTLTSLFDQPIGSDADILAAVSSDYGQSWSVPFLISADGADDGFHELRPAIATDAKGAWVIAWESSNPDGGAGEDTDIRAAYSTDNGLTWTEAGLVNAYGTSDNAGDRRPAIATDGFGTWICLWSTTASVDGAGPDEDIVYALSFDNGASWSAPLRADDSAADPELQPIDDLPSVAADRSGNWAASWTKSSVVNLLLRPGVVGARGEFTGTLSGRIANGPYTLACAAVVATGLDSGVERRTVADDNGRYTLANLPVGVYRVQVFAPEHATAEADVVVSGSAALEQNFSLLRTPLSGGVFGRVIDADTGQPPLVSVKVEAFVGSVSLGATYTCASGAYELAVPAVKGAGLPVDIAFTQNGYEPETQTALIDPPGNVELDVTLEKAVGSPATLAGMVRSGTSSAPIAGARVTLDGRINVSTTADANGLYLFAAIPEGIYTVRASAKRYKGATVTAAASLIPSQVEFALEDDPSAGPNRADINGDESVNAVDIQLVINGALGFQSGYIVDLNDDGVTDAIDVQAAILAALNL